MNYGIYVHILYRHYIGIVFPDSLLATSKLVDANADLSKSSWYLSTRCRMLQDTQQSFKTWFQLVHVAVCPNEVFVLRT